MSQRFGPPTSQTKTAGTETHSECRFRAHSSQTSLRDRSGLLGETYNTPPASGRSSPLPTFREDFAPSGHRFADDLEGQNDERLEGLTAKVKLLKDVSAAVGLRLSLVTGFRSLDIHWDWKRSEELGPGS